MKQADDLYVQAAGLRSQASDLINRAKILEQIAKELPKLQEKKINKIDNDGEIKTFSKPYLAKKLGKNIVALYKMIEEKEVPDGDIKVGKRHRYSAELLQTIVVANSINTNKKIYVPEDDKVLVALPELAKMVKKPYANLLGFIQRGEIQPPKHKLPNGKRTFYTMTEANKIVEKLKNKSKDKRGRHLGVKNKTIQEKAEESKKLPKDESSIDLEKYVKKVFEDNKEKKVADVLMEIRNLGWQTSDKRPSEVVCQKLLELTPTFLTRERKEDCFVYRKAG